MPAAQLAPAAHIELRREAFAPALQSLAAGDRAWLAEAYQARGFQPIWFDEAGPRPAARELLNAIGSAAEDGLDPAAYALGTLEAAVQAAANRDARAVAQADLLLSRALASWVRDLHTPAPGAEMLYADAAVRPRATDPAAVLKAISQAATPEAGLAELRTMSGPYEEFRSALREARSGGDRAAERLLRANLERARGLPADLGARYVLVDVAAQELQMWEGGQLVDTMAVVVGKRSQPTPAMAGMIRFLVLRPYWHMPPDVAAERVAPAVLRDGPGVLARQGLEAVTSFRRDTQPVDAAGIDWGAVARGEAKAWLRQTPGPGNTMGRVKFIFPNRLGVYLHDTPDRAWFATDRRTASSGCVRVADADRLARWAMGAPVDLVASGPPEQRVDLPEPLPVYLVYFTARVTKNGVERRADLYGRDAGLLANLSGGRAAGSPLAAGAPRRYTGA